MDVRQFLLNHVEQMESEAERLQAEIEALRVQKETMLKEALRLRTALAAIPLKELQRPL